ncbi:MAG: HEAT repeat domain-containing protein [Pyrinomonadaceae bacterium]
MDRDELLELLKKLNEKRLDFKERSAIFKQIVAAPPELRQELCQILEREEDESFKIELLNIIGATQDDYFEVAVGKTLQSEASVEVLQTAATTLGKLRGKNSFGILIGLLNHPSPNVRLGSIYGLTALSDTRAVKYLLQSLDDQEAARCWWPSSKAGGYIIAKEAAIAIDALTGESFKGNKEKIEEWIKDNNTPSIS